MINESIPLSVNNPDIYGALQRGKQDAAAEIQQSKRNAILDLDAQSNQIQNKQRAGQVIDEETKRSLYSTAEGAVKTNEFLNNNDVEGLTNYLQLRKSTIEQRGGDSSETDAALQLAQSGDFATLGAKAQEAIKSAQSLGILSKTGAVQGDIEYLTQGLTEEQKQKAREIRLGLQPRAGSTTFDERLARDQDLTNAVSSSQADIAAAKQEALQTQTPKGLADTRRAQNEADISQAKLDTESLARSQEVEALRSSERESFNAINILNEVLTDGSYKNLYGSFDGRKPDLFHSQGALDSKAKIDQVVSLLSLDSRKKLAGQGAITDSEAATLARSETILTNPLVSDATVTRELERIRGIFEDSATKYGALYETVNGSSSAQSGQQAEQQAEQQTRKITIDQVQSLPPQNSNGWVLMFDDVNGAAAYVSPDGTQFEEVN